MARKTRSRNPDESARESAVPPGAQAMRDSAQRILLAGLGAFERARSEGPRFVETLVEQGRNLGARALGAADGALKEMREAGGAGGRMEKLEQVFEERVSRSLERLGVLTRREVEALSRQVGELDAVVRRMAAAQAPAATKRPAAKRPRKAAATGAARKPARKRASRA